MLTVPPLQDEDAGVGGGCGGGGRVGGGRVGEGRKINTDPIMPLLISSSRSIVSSSGSGWFFGTSRIWARHIGQKSNLSEQDAQQIS